MAPCVTELRGRKMGTSYEKDVVAWANEQAALLRAGKFSALDIEHIAEEIEDVGKSEQRELISRMAVLLAHLLKWQFQSARRGASWQRTIKAQRLDVAYLLDEAPSLKPKLADAEWMRVVWAKALAQAVSETGLDVFPETCPWSMEQVLDEEFMPD
ncbi:hypothetical protein LMG24076_02409 [Trinickia soli]|nr:hypothetical protein LMG24076_02400 [Trinickia soli]CAB3680598.1 hypothetical protein LMG24076_02409 [Trinickia soli]